VRNYESPLLVFLIVVLFLGLLLITILGTLGRITHESAELTVIGLTGVAVVVYTGVTLKLVVETQRLRKAQTRPYVVLSHDSQNEPVYARNVGQGPALDIKISLLEQQSREDELAQEFRWEIRAMPHRIPCLVAGERIPIRTGAFDPTDSRKLSNNEDTKALVPGPLNKADWIVEIHYFDIDYHPPYKSRFQAGKSGIKVLEL
jgi:hypothetical protein